MKTYLLYVSALGFIALNTGCTAQITMMDDSDCGSGFYTGTDGGCLYWHQSSVTFYMTTSASTVNANVVQAVRDAASEWNRYMSSPQIVISGTYVNNGVDSDGMNIIHFEQSSWDPSRSNVQGTTYIAASNRMLEADIALNLVNFTLSVGAQPFKVDAKSLALHEFGHALGLVHATEYFGRVMSPTLPYNYNRECLFDGDLERLGNIYNLVNPVPSTLDPDTYFGWGRPASAC